MEVWHRYFSPSLNQPTKLCMQRYLLKITLYIFIVSYACKTTVCARRLRNAETYTYAVLPSQENSREVLSLHLQKRDININATSIHTNISAYTTHDLPTSTLSSKNISSTSSSPKNNQNFDPDSGTDDELDLSKYNTSAKAKFDHHKYYTSFSKAGVQDTISYRVDFENLPEEKIVTHDSLSSAHRRALTVALSFEFPFYGHTLRNITIATGGFLFTGPFVHKWLAATQYIAPLMANFDTSVSENARVKYADNGTSFTVEWENVALQDNPAVGNFTFQVTIHKSGRIVFFYKHVPMIVTLIEDMQHPVKVGLSDAYILEKTVYYVRQKTIYEYHKIDLKDGFQINNWTAIVFEPVPMCVALDSCESCLGTKTAFECMWCDSLGKCSDGLDRHRQSWVDGKCRETAVSSLSVCARLPPRTNLRPSSGEASPREAAAKDPNSNTGGQNGGLVGFLFFLLLLACVCGWLTYAYFNPHTRSGQMLIKYRPSNWSWLRGEARYTAATMHSIHM